MFISPRDLAGLRARHGMGQAAPATAATTFLPLPSAPATSTPPTIGGGAQTNAEAQQLLQAVTQLQSDASQASQDFYSAQTDLVARQQRNYGLAKQLAALQGKPTPAPPSAQPLPPYATLQAQQAAALKTQPSGFESAAAAQGFPQLPTTPSLSDLLRRRVARIQALSGMAGSGAQEWLQGQLSKISSMAQAGEFTSMLAELMGITPAASGMLTQPDQALASPTVVAALKSQLEQNFSGQSWEAAAEVAIDSMAASLAGKTLPTVPTGADLLTQAQGYAFDPNAWQATTGNDDAVIAANAPATGLTKVVGKTGIKVLVATNGVMATLDHYVPGWSVVVDLLGAPILLDVALTAVKTLVSSNGKITVNPKTILPVITSALPFYSPLIGGVGSTVFMAKPVTDALVQVASVLAPVNFTFSNIAWVAVSTDGPFLTKLEAVGMEALSDVSLVVMIGGLVCSLGALSIAEAAVTAAEATVADTVADTASVASFNAATAALASAQASVVAIQTGIVAINALSLSLTALKTGITLEKTLAASQAAAHASDVAKEQAAIQAQKLDAQAQAIQSLIDQINALNAQIANTGTPAVSSVATEVSSVATAPGAATVFTTQNLLIGGVFAALLTAGVVVYILSDDD